VTICNALLLNREPNVPPPFTGWPYNPSSWARVRNNLGYFASDRLTRPIAEVVQGCRKSWGLRPHRTPEESFSPLAQISQQPELFDFPRQHLAPSFHYVGPLRRPKTLRPEFPWARLDGRPLIYASLGTLQNSRPDIFHLFAEACQGTNSQLVIAHGGGMTEEQEKQLPGNTVAVSYAPQLELLARSALTITHAGLNTVLDSLTFGVPLIAIPITYEQPAIARRIVFRSVGETIPFQRLTPDVLRNKIRRLLALDSPYRANAAKMAGAIRAAGGVT
jgi:MGT family glycosyltransferase